VPQVWYVLMKDHTALPASRSFSPQVEWTTSVFTCNSVIFVMAHKFGWQTELQQQWFSILC